MVGHLREEKSPRTLFEAVALLAQHRDIQIQHIGAPHDQTLASIANQTAALYPQYQFTGALSYPQTRHQIQRAHVLVHTSVMEGGAHVIMEAVCSGVPVIASRIAGNMGMLGEDYAGLFPVGDAKALANMLVRFRRVCTIAKNPMRSARTFICSRARTQSLAYNCGKRHCGASFVLSLWRFKCPLFFASRKFHESH
jgi:glycosyltransferase involved in cell wall biosynthesis